MVFYGTAAEKIGPVRSARPYLLDIAKEWNGVYVHVGGSPDALSILEKGSWPYINEFAYGSYFWRDKSRSAPNNLYTSTELLMQVLDKKGWDVQKTVRAFSFLAEGESQRGEPANSIKINYADSSTKNSYIYDSETGLYNRYLGGKEQLDGETGVQLTVSNVLVQYVRSKVLDSELRLEIDMFAGGKALLFSQGKVLTGTWERKDASSPTVFKDENGNEWKLASGRTWIQVIDQQCTISYENN